MGTANRLYRGLRGLVLLCIDEDRATAECRYEAPADGPANDRQQPRFPHLYGPLNLHAVLRVVPFPCRADGMFEMPAEVHAR